MYKRQGFDGGSETTVSNGAVGQQGIFSWPIATPAPNVSSCWNDDRTGGVASAGIDAKEGYFHSGLDITAPMNSPIIASADGVVENLEYDREGRGRGNTVVLNHSAATGGQMLFTQYQHLNVFRVTVGQSVKRGEVIGLSGNTGKSSGPHLHFNIQPTAGPWSRAVETYNPLDWLPQIPDSSRTNDSRGYTCIPGPVGHS